MVEPNSKKKGYHENTREAFNIKAWLVHHDFLPAYLNIIGGLIVLANSVLEIIFQNITN